MSFDADETIEETVNGMERRTMTVEISETAKKAVELRHGRHPITNEPSRIKMLGAALITEIEELQGRVESSVQKRRAAVAITEVETAVMWAEKAKY